MTRSLLAEPINVRAILAEHNASERAMIKDYYSAYDAAQAALNAPKPLVDENGVEFTEGQRIENAMELWDVRSGAQKILWPKMPATLVSIGETHCAVRFDGDAPGMKAYLARRDRMRAAFRVVA